jgi:predicted nucleic acid-binding protein
MRVEAVELTGAPLMTLVAMPPVARRASALARELDHPVYDCFYLALAEREDVPLVTGDGRLVGKVARTRWGGLVRRLGPVRAGQDA